MQLSIIIVSYNVRYFLEQCLYSVIRATARLDAEILVVDNHSTDGTPDFFADRFPQVRFTWNTTNVGFAQANNQALMQCKGQYVLFLNPDTLLPEDCLEQCLSFLQQRPPGALGIRMMDGSGRFLRESKRGYPSLMASLWKLTGFTTLFPHSAFFSSYYAGHLDEHHNQEIAILAGAFMLIPDNILKQTGSFDERFFMYGEDIDLSYRIQKAGYKNYYFAGSAILHFKGESTRKADLRYIRLFYGAMRLFVQKQLPPFKAAVYQLFIRIAASCAMTLTLLKNLLRKPEQVSFKTKILYGNTWILSSEETYQRLASCINSPFMQLIGNQSPKSSAEDIQYQIREHSIQTILFCTEELTITDLSLLQELAGAVRVGFYSVQAGSIVFSSDKNRNGSWLLL